jgi:diacylglycerol kinase family enzyme
MRRVTLFHNPKAGDESHEGDELMECLRAAGFEPTYQSTKKNYKPALRDPGDLVVVAGGDGTIRKIATRLAGGGVPVAIVPLGTANNIAKTLGAVGDPRRLIEGLSTAKRKRFDVWAARGAWGEERFMEGAGFGLFTETMSALDEREEKKAFAPAGGGERIAAALRALYEALPRFEPVELSVELDGRELSGRYLLLEAMNIRHVGPNLLLAPDADPGDGYLDLVLVEEDRRGELAGYLENRLDGKQEAPLLPARRGRHLRVVYERASLHLDDKLLPDESERSKKSRGPKARTAATASPFTLDVRIGQAALDFLVPA